MTQAPSSTFDWTRSAEESFGPKLPAGLHRVRIVRVQHTNREGVPLISKNNDPQMRVVYQDQEAREVSEIFTLSEKAGWTLARLMSAAGANLAAMTARGVTPAHFADPTFANKQLIGRELQVQVTYEISKSDGKEYSVVTPIRPQGGTGQAAAAAPAPTAAPQAAPATPASAASSAPAAPAAAPSGILTKEAAWAYVCQKWATYTGPDLDAKRANAWINAVSATATLKPESEFAAPEWTEVATRATHTFA